MNEGALTASIDDPGELAVSVRGLEKSYRGVPALRGVDLSIRRGEVFALLGPNGAGKTTTLEILEGYATRDRGQVRVLGLDPRGQPPPLKRRIGMVLQSPGVDRYLTVAETVAMYAALYPRPRAVDAVIRLVGLEGDRNARVGRLSRGSSGGWTWPSPWSATRSCFSSTSRPRALILRPGATPGR